MMKIRNMIRNSALALAVLSLALAGGCAKGGNGAGNGITVVVSDVAVVGLTLSVTFTATVTGTSNKAVAWSISGAACGGNPNPCGMIDANTGVYTAPTTEPNPSVVTITAVSRADSTARGETATTIVPVTVVVTPQTPTVGQNLAEQFTAIAAPDSAPQTFTWSCTPTGSCGTITQDPNVSGLVTYTAPASNGNVVLIATSTVPESPAGVGQAKVTVATSRLAAGSYAFKFSGYDSGGHPVAVAGSLTVASNGSITGIEDELTASGPQKNIAITSGSYSPTSNNNNLGTLTLNLSGGVTNKYTAVITSTGIIRMIEADSTGRTGSGIIQESATKFNAAAGTFVFGFTGVDSMGNRVGYVGLLPMTPTSATAGNITGGLFDVNDNATDPCGTQPCNVTGTYTADANIAGLWHMTLNSEATLDFDFYVSAGQTKNMTNPLTLYAISTDTIDGAHPAISGSMVYQFPMTYNNAAFAGPSVSNLTGANANVSLTNGLTDGTSGGTGGTGGFTGTSDQNNNGVITSIPPDKPFSYTYVAASSNNGRYTFQMLGDPNANPVVAPLPFILYASGANRGFLLDQSSASVMTGTMDPQPPKAGNSYTFSGMSGTFAAATISNSNSSVTPVVQNLLLTSPGNSVFNVAGTQNPGNQAIAGTYTMQFTGVGAFALTAPPPPAAPAFVIYAIDIDTTTFAITDFMMMSTCTPLPCTGVPSSIVFAQQ